MGWIRKTVFLSVLLVVTIFFMRDMWKPGLPMLHDSNPHIARMISFHTALDDGQFPPMWAKELFGGIGSPVMMLNYQLPYFISEVFVRIGFDYFEAYKATLALSFVLSGVFMYLALASKYKPLAAYLGAMVYTLAPYRFVDIYVRGALGESLSFIFAPLLLWGYFKSSRPLLILGWAGLFLTHPVAAATFSAFFLGYTLLFGKQKSLGSKLADFFVPYLVALAIAMFNLLPTLTLTKYTYYDPGLSDTLLMFPTLGQLIKSPWGYGISLPGPNDGMSFEIGIISWMILVIGTIWAVFRKNRMMGYLSALTWLTILLILPVSLPLYEIFLGRIIDFPWRLLMCIVFATAWMGASIISNLKWQISNVLLAIVTAVLITQALPMAQTDKYWGVDKDVAFFAQETGDSYGEYAPLTRETRDSSPFGMRAEFVSGTGSIETLIEKSNRQKYLINSDAVGIVRINTIYFPGWVIPDSCKVSKRTLNHIDDSGMMLCNVPQGQSTLEIIFEPPTVQKVGTMLTLVGIGLYLWILFRSYYPRSTKKTR